MRLVKAQTYKLSPRGRKNKMSNVTLRTCDNCENIVENNEELWTIGVVAVCNANPKLPFPRIFNPSVRSTSNNRLLQDHWKDFCRPCMEQKGLVVAPNHEPATEPDTLESLLTELIEEKVQDAMEGQY